MITALTAVGITVAIFVGLAVVLAIAEKKLADYGECTVSINDGSQAFSRKGGVSLLSALYERKIFI